jgi:hypothetical protein
LLPPRRYYLPTDGTDLALSWNPNHGWLEYHQVSYPCPRGFTEQHASEVLWTRRSDRCQQRSSLSRYPSRAPTSFLLHTYVLLQACMSYIATSVRLCLASWIRPSVEHTHTHTHEFSWVLMLLRRTPPAEVLQARTRLGTNPLGGLTAEDGVRRGHYALNPPLLLHFRSVRRDATLLTYH